MFRLRGLGYVLACCGVPTNIGMFLLSITALLLLLRPIAFFLVLICLFFIAATPSTYLYSLHQARGLV